MRAYILLGVMLTLLAGCATDREVHGGIGGQHVGMISGAIIRDGRQDRPGDVYRLNAEGSVMVIPTARGSLVGVEYEGGIGHPMGSFFGYPELRAGLRVPAIDNQWLRLSLALGVGGGAHLYGYVQPRLGLSLPGVLELEASYLWIPAQASHRWGQDFFEGIPGIGYNRARLMALVRISGDRRYGLLELSSYYGLGVYVERHRVGGPDDPDDRATPGTWWGAGVGIAF